MVATAGLGDLWRNGRPGGGRLGAPLSSGSSEAGTVAACVPGTCQRGGGGHGHALWLCERRTGRATARGGHHGHHDGNPRPDSSVTGDRSARSADHRALQFACDRPLLWRAHVGARRLVVLRPLLAWLTELPYLHRMPAWARGLSRVAMVGALVVAVVVHAQRKFVDDLQAPSGSAPKEPSAQDYLDFGR